MVVLNSHCGEAKMAPAVSCQDEISKELILVMVVVVVVVLDAQFLTFANIEILRAGEFSFLDPFLAQIDGFSN